MNFLFDYDYYIHIITYEPKIPSWFLAVQRESANLESWATVGLGFNLPKSSYSFCQEFINSCLSFLGNPFITRKQVPTEKHYHKANNKYEINVL